MIITNSEYYHKTNQFHINIELDYGELITIILLIAN